MTEDIVIHTLYDTRWLEEVKNAVAIYAVVLTLGLLTAKLADAISTHEAKNIITYSIIYIFGYIAGCVLLGFII